MLIFHTYTNLILKDLIKGNHLHMREIGLTELKEIQIDILDFVDDFCKRHHIKYFLTGGTLIGAVRHKGYIPWDDDIDLCMLRDDYDRFLNLFPKESQSKYKIYSNTLGEKYPIPFVKVANIQTLLKEDVIIPSDIGVNIDIFPLDTIPIDKKLQKKLYRKFGLYFGMLQMKEILWSSKRSFHNNLIMIISRYLLKAVPYSFILKKINENAVKYKDIDSPLCGDLVWGYGIREITKKENFRDSIDCEFEGKIYPVPVGYDSYLQGVYGNYMMLPPEEKRVSSHNVEAWWRE